MRCYLAAAVALALAGGLSAASAHTTVSVGDYDIEAGWGIEPPIVGIRNEFVFEVTMPGEAEGVKTGVRDAFRNLDATAKFGGVTKELEINSAPTPGHYFADVIPTKTGSITILVSGQIDGTTVEVEIPVEDVETTSVLDFPPRTSSGNDNTDAIWAAIKQLQKGAPSVNQNSDSAYDIAILGLSLGAAGVVLAVVAMLKRK